MAPVDQAILELALVGGLTLAQVADRVGLTHEAARARKSRALRKLAETLRCHTRAPGGD